MPSLSVAALQPALQPAPGKGWGGSSLCWTCLAGAAAASSCILPVLQVRRCCLVAFSDSDHDAVQVLHRAQTEAALQA